MGQFKFRCNTNEMKNLLVLIVMFSVSYSQYPPRSSSYSGTPKCEKKYEEVCGDMMEEECTTNQQEVCFTTQDQQCSVEEREECIDLSAVSCSQSEEEACEQADSVECRDEQVQSWRSNVQQSRERNVNMFRRRYALVTVNME